MTTSTTTPDHGPPTPEPASAGRAGGCPSTPSGPPNGNTGGKLTVTKKGFFDVYGDIDGDLYQIVREVEPEIADRLARTAADQYGRALLLGGGGMSFVYQKVRPGIARVLQGQLIRFYGGGQT